MTNPEMAAPEFELGQPVTCRFMPGSIGKVVEIDRSRSVLFGHRYRVEWSDHQFFRESGVRHAVVCVQSWAGRTEKPCLVVGETPKYYRIEVEQVTPLPTGFSTLVPGMRKLVPKHAIRFIDA